MKRQKHIFILSTIHLSYKGNEYWGHSSVPCYWNYEFKIVENVLIRNARYYEDCYNKYAVIEKVPHNPLDIEVVQWYKFILSTPGVLGPNTIITMEKCKCPEELKLSCGFCGFSL